MPPKWPNGRTPISPNSDSRPRWSNSSIVRAEKPSARDCRIGSVSFSVTIALMPARRSSPASIRPVGPPPTMRTSVSKSCIFLPHFRAHQFPDRLVQVFFAVAGPGDVAVGPQEDGVDPRQGPLLVDRLDRGD